MKFETPVINEPSVFEPMKFYCIHVIIVLVIDSPNGIFQCVCCY